jgi:ABC-type sulfate/molybdate transport systems ATPase subunit
MHDGRIEQVGAPADVWHEPANAFVARFLGWNVTRAFSGSELAVRAAGIRLTKGAGVTGVVTARTFRRDHFLLDIDLDEGDERLQVQVPLDAPQIPAVDDRVALVVDPAVAVRLT